MTPLGPPDEWVNLIDTMVPDILDLVISTWEAMPSPGANAREDPTTVALCRGMRLNRNSNNLPFRIDTQVIELDPAAGEDQGRMDIVFSPMVPRESIYFCLECKRLNVVKNGHVRPYSSEYVSHGMLRFIRGQYAAFVRHGGMLGYVLDGNVAQAIQNVSSIIQGRFEELRMQAPGEMLPSSVRPDDSRLRETYHCCRHTSDIFCIHHIFATFSSGT